MYLLVAKMDCKFMYWFALIMVMYCESSLAWRSYKIIFESFAYDCKAEIIDVKAEVRNTTGESTLNMVFNLKQDIDDGYINMHIGMENEEGNYTIMTNRTQNICQILNTRMQQGFLRTLYEDMAKHGNFFKSCPIKKGMYTLTDYRLDEELLPSYIPEAGFVVGIQVDLPKSGLIFNSTLLGFVDKTKGFNNLKMFSMG